jgi:hypothetical protein
MHMPVLACVPEFNAEALMTQREKRKRTSALHTLREAIAICKQFVSYPRVAYREAYGVRKSSSAFLYYFLGKEGGNQMATAVAYSSQWLIEMRIEGLSNIDDKVGEQIT